MKFEEEKEIDAKCYLGPLEASLNLSPRNDFSSPRRNLGLPTSGANSANSTIRVGEGCLN
jgi:hypothetical protein